MKYCENCECIVKFHELYIFEQLVWMFIEYMNGGSLTELIYSYFCKLSEKQIAYIMKNILTGVWELHSKGKIHRDLKSDNILLNTAGEVKICDLGLSV